MHRRRGRRGGCAHAPTCLIHDDVLLIHSCDHAEDTSEKNAVIRFWKRCLPRFFLVRARPLSRTVRRRDESNGEINRGPNENKEKKEDSCI